MPSRFFHRMALVLVLGSGAISVRAADPIPPEQFGKMHGLIKPKPTEQKWEQIPWLTDLWQARQRAATEGKPILLWEMDGHPLGCT